MPPSAGETTLLTIFVDIHYFFSPQNYKPLHHRFEKASYLYIHHSASDGRGRIEVANNAGTPDQDAFAGALENAHVTYSYKKPTFVSIILPTGTQAPQKPWQIPAFDPQNQSKYKYSISSVDLYLWSPEDALDLVEAFGAIKSIGALNVESPPEEHDPHRDTVSPVVQQLEQAAIGPPYKRESTSTTQSYLGPPSATPSATTQTSSEAAAAAAAPAPMAYNPAAPPAPEARVHREKTPPPPDAEVPIGASVAAAHHHIAQNQSQGPVYPYNQQAQVHQGAPTSSSYSFSPQQQPSFLPSTAQQHSQEGQSPPPQSQYPYAFAQQQQHQYGPAATAYSPQPSSYNQPSPPPPPPQLNQTYQPPLASPGVPSAPPQQQQQQPNAAAAPFGYSTYSYSTQQQPIQPAHSIHQQVYRPTESEAGKIHPSQMPSAQLPGQMQQANQAALSGKGNRVEKSVNRFLQRLDKW